MQYENDLSDIEVPLTGSISEAFAQVEQRLHVLLNKNDAHYNDIILTIKELQEFVENEMDYLI